MAKKKKIKLDAICQSGLIFVGDPSFLAESQHSPDAQKAVSNVFADWGAYTEQFDQAEASNPKLAAHKLPLIPFQEEWETGKGIVLQTHQHGSKFQVKKKVCKETGKVLEIKVIFG